MQKFTYVIKDELGIHARPAGLLVKEAKKFASTITLSCGEKKAVAKATAIILPCVRLDPNQRMRGEQPAQPCQRSPC